MKRAKSKFKVNPYKAGKNLLDPKCYCSLKVDQHKSYNLFDKNYDTPLDNLEGQPPEPCLLKKLIFLAILVTCRNASAPYKKCPKASKFSFKNFQACFKRCQIPIQWQSAQEIYIPKISTLTPSNTKISDFRLIALLNVEGKLFFSLISMRLETNLICNNKFIYNSIQNGCMEKVPGWWEHLFMVWHALKEARTQKSTLATIWLDIANAHGSILHKLIVLLYIDMGSLHSG